MKGGGNKSSSSAEDDPQPSTSGSPSGNSTSVVKHEEDMESELPELFSDNDDSKEAPSREEVDDKRGFVESNAMRMNAASALTFGHNRSGVKDATGIKSISFL